MWWMIMNGARLMSSWLSWECLCGHRVCQWCDGWDDSDMITQYNLPKSQVRND